MTIGEALAGARLSVETVTGTVMLKVPKGSNTGTVLRLRGKGVPSVGAAGKTGAGDHLLELQVMLPPSPDDAFIQSVMAWEAAHPYDPRASGQSKTTGAPA